MRTISITSFFATTVLTLATLPACRAAAVAPLQKFAITDYLHHRFVDELVHFDFDVPATPNLLLTDGAGQALPAQFTNRVTKGGRTRGKVWTVLTLAPDATAVFALRRGHTGIAAAVRVTRAGNEFVIANDRLQLRLPNWPGQLPKPQNLGALQAPINGVRAAAGAWLGGAAWFSGPAPLMVKSASTVVLENGPVRAMVRQMFVLADGRHYSAVITLAARQDVATIKEESDIDDAAAGWRLNMDAGLGADHVFWNNQWQKTEHAGTWGLTDSAVKFDTQNIVARMRPWSYWWEGDMTMWAGFYHKGATPFVGIMLLNPSQWSPWGYDGFARSEIPITARAGGGLDLSLAFAAHTRKLDERDLAVIADDPTLLPAAPAIGTAAQLPLRRQWGIAVGTVAGNVLDPEPAMKQMYAGDPAGIPTLRRQLLKYGEFPLDEVKDYDFDFKSTNEGKQHPFLLFTAADVQRVRRQAKTNPAVKAEVDAAINYIAGCGGADKTLKNEGAEAFFDRHYMGNGLEEKLPEAYLGSDNPIYGEMMAAAVKMLARKTSERYLEAPVRPSLGSYGPWFAEDFTRLLFAYDTIADSGLLSAADNAAVYHCLVFGAQLLGNPDFWDVNHGLASGNPNMTSMIRLPNGLLGLYLAGHPKAAMWRKDAETELKLEISDLIALPDPGIVAETNMRGGAWYENPSYQTASLDGMMLLATALRNVLGRDYFADPNFKATLGYHGYLLTPPDRRFPPRPSSEAPTLGLAVFAPPATLPSIGDGQAGAIYPYNGWMAAATQKTDPAYSAEQQFFWKQVNFHFKMGNRAKGYTLALCDAELPATPPADLQRGYPGFGSVSRTSFTDPRASYLVHRTGRYAAHFHDDQGEILYYAKGAPLCLDFGNQYQPVRRDEPWYHNRVSFDFPDSGRRWGGLGNLMEVSSLPQVLYYSHGDLRGAGNQESARYALLIAAADPMGANYVVMRDTTSDGQNDQHFWFNLWCAAKDTSIAGNTVHFTGQFDIDLDLHVLAPANPQITKDQWGWKSFIGNYGIFEEAQQGIHINKKGSSEDFLTVLYPRAPGQAAAKVAALAGGAAIGVGHMEGADLVLLSPGKPNEATNGDAAVKGEIAFVRRNNDGGIRLATIQGDCTASAAGYSLSSDGAVALMITGRQIKGRSSGTPHQASISLPAATSATALTFTLDGKAWTVQHTGTVWTLQLPGGAHSFAIE